MSNTATQLKQGQIIEFTGKTKSGIETTFFGIIRETGVIAKSGKEVLRVSEGRFKCLDRRETTVFASYADSSFGLCESRVLRVVRNIRKDER